jgi:hypothetical protein
MGFPFHSTGCVKCAKESWNEKPHHQRLGSPQRGVNRRLTAHRPDDASTKRNGGMVVGEGSPARWPAKQVAS